MEERPKPTVLIVDDTETNIDILLEGLADDYEVSVAMDGASALETVHENIPDLILLDIMMPGMNGYQVCSQLKQNPDTRDIPVLFVSALTETVDKVKGFRMGGLDYITKPFQIEEVRARIHTHLELHRLRREIQQHYDILKELEELKDNLVSMIVHDFRSPLQSIQGFVELALTENISESAGEYLNHVARSAEYLCGMATDLLDITRIEEGNMPIEPEHCDLFLLARGVMQAMQGAAKNHDTSLDAPEEAIYARCDPKIITRVLTNLLGNALNHTPEGTRITIHLRTDADMARVEITDNGPGIPEDSQERVFDKFQQVALRKEGIKLSSGLGLTFCKMAIESHGGSIGLDSREGHGCTFWFTLPQSTAADQPDRNLETAPSTHKRPTILVVEDDREARAFYTSVLENEGYEVLQASDGIQASSLLQKHSFVLIITDVIMPEKDGLELLMQVRHDHPETPTVILSGGIGRSYMDIWKAAELLGAHTALRKPLAAQTLLETVRDILGDQNGL